MYAHTPRPGESTFHKLTEHVAEVCRLAESFADRFDARQHARALAILHDAGKLNPAFQRYLQALFEDRDPDVHPSHARYGALLAAELNAQHLVNALRGHHSGLINKSALNSFLTAVQQDPAYQDIRQATLALWPELQTLALSYPLPKAPTNTPQGRSAELLRRELWQRMLFSTLVDADYLDTEAHFQPHRAQQRDVTLQPNLSDLLTVLQRDQDALQRDAVDSPVNATRKEIYERCQASARSDRGVFRLTTPTGGGKTRSGLAFALEHAVQQELKRVIIAVPYTSITTQTAEVYRGLFGPTSVVEHHSASPAETPFSRLRLASENWDAPLIVTTTVQLLESLHTARPGRARKLHNIAKSVIVIDEVQTLPVALTQPTVTMLQALVDDYQCSVVLCTATQPALEGTSPYLAGFRSVTDIVPVKEAERHFELLRRVTYHYHPNPRSWRDLADEVLSERQALAVLNTRRDAIALHDALQDPDALHLSTLQCGAHRADVLRTVRARLDPRLPFPARAPCRLTSTQVIEAGVDVDFPFVMRALGPLDRIIQSGGRCNREGRLHSPGRVSIVIPDEGTLPPTGGYGLLTRHAQRHLERGANLNDRETAPRYFADVYRSIDTDANCVLQARLDHAFADTEERYRLIPEDTTSVYVPYRADIHARLAELERHPSRRLLRTLAPYAISLREGEYRKAQAAGLIEELPSGLAVWIGPYHPVFGARALLDL
ncbi:CRISPR-associated Cas3 family helicase [Deinococcus yavapaiensis KR-236]|uniref:CRISPR-associated Cas3 family helicase n=2 Tax=Deinococcus TaxID=1298 RepID=A0A318SB83_9DEIO|nr:CRISPR-associated endonuclease Cas3'' [Deinococcus yavapaiensis]PYE55480.1 CRISPR-associated Cas3 family helicase [Deinococcus yavapaiensis KR-236]